jgi:membrane protease YdiL (CAAX protease family)
MFVSVREVAAPKRDLRWVLFGSDGLRAGWGVLLFFALAIATLVLVGVIMEFGHVHGPKMDASVMSPASVIFQEAVLAGAAVTATLCAGLIERRRLSRLGVGLRGVLPRFVQGLLAGLAMMTALVGALWGGHAVQIDRIALHDPDALRSGLQWALAFLLVAVAEELVFRGYLLQTLARGLNFRWASLITSGLFLAAHLGNPGETTIGLAAAFLFGAVSCLSVWRTGTVWWAMGFHTAWNWTQTFVFGVADSGQHAVGALATARPIGVAWMSGGATGPEGSALALAAALLTAGVVFLTLRKKDETLDGRW